jgi:ABC-type multidrug transport system fused ATPase/permease subunit
MTKILIDTILMEAPTGPIDTFLTNYSAAKPIWPIACGSSPSSFRLGLSRGLLFFFRMYLRGVVETNIGREMQLRLFYHIERLPYPALKKSKSGDIIQTAPATRKRSSIS